MKYYHFTSLASTNDRLLEMAEEGAPEWTVVTADIQTSGRGRDSRKWWSPIGNLHMSILVRPETGPGELMRLPLLSALAFLDALGESGSCLVVKWPNDVLFEGRKLAGILVESRSEGAKVLWAVVGFGVNMARREDLPSDLKGRLASVRELDPNVSKEDLTDRITESLKRRSGSMSGEAWERARQEWAMRAVLDIPYIYRDRGREIKGIARRLDSSGGLVLETERGEITVYSGELEKTVQSPSPFANAYRPVSEDRES